MREQASEILEALESLQLAVSCLAQRHGSDEQIEASLELSARHSTRARIAAAHDARLAAPSGQESQQQVKEAEQTERASPAPQTPRSEAALLAAFPDCKRLAEGVIGWHFDTPNGIYIPIILAVNDGSGDVGRYLDSLPRDRDVKFPTVMNAKLAAMLKRRGFVDGAEWSKEHDAMCEMLVRPASAPAGSERGAGARPLATATAEAEHSASASTPAPAPTAPVYHSLVPNAELERLRAIELAAADCIHLFDACRAIEPNGQRVNDALRRAFGREPTTPEAESRG